MSTPTTLRCGLTALAALAWCVTAAVSQRDSSDTISSIKGKRPAAKSRTTTRDSRRTKRTAPRVAKPKPAVRPLPPAPRLAVDSAGRSPYRTISAAVAAAPAGASIVVRGGTYREAVVVDKPVTIVAASADDPVVVEAAGSACLTARASATVRDLTFQSVGPMDGRAAATVDLLGGKPVLERCEATGGKSACIVVHGTGTEATLRQCRAHRSGSVGFEFADHGRATVIDGEAFDCATNGIDVVGGASVKALRTKLHDNKRAGALVDYAALQLDNVEAFNNAWVGIAIRHLSKGSLRFCRAYGNGVMGIWLVEKSETQAESCDAHDNAASGIQAIGVDLTALKGCTAYANKENGIHTWDAKVTLDACDCYGNTQAGIWLQGETPIAKGCRTHDNVGHGLRITDGGIATVEDCDSAANDGIGVSVESGGRPTIRGSRLHDNKVDGATVTGPSTTGLFVDCDVYGNAESGIGILGASPIIQKCRLNGNKNGLVVNGGRGTAEDCNANGNVRAGLAALAGGTLSAVRCTATRNKICGFFVDNDAVASFDRCESTGNAESDLLMRPKGKATFLGCRIDRSREEGGGP